MARMKGREVVWDLWFHNDALHILVNSSGEVLSANEYSHAKRQNVDVTTIVQNDPTWTMLITEELKKEREKESVLIETIRSFRLKGAL